MIRERASGQPRTISDETEALHPLHIEPDSAQPPATYPWGL